MENRGASSVSESLRQQQQYTPISIDYSSTINTSGGDHEYSSLHDMIAVDVNSNVESLYPPMDIPVGKPDVSSSTSDMYPSNSVHSSPNTQLPPISSAQQNIDLDSSVSNLSWLHSLQQQMPVESNGNPNLMVNPSTVTPISNTQSVRVVTLPSNVHISNSSNIKYVTVPTSKQQVYISSTKSTMSPQQYASNRSSIGYQRSYGHSPGSVPSSTVPDNPFPKPAYSYSCLIALSLKNSRRGSLPVAEIYNFMMQNFPYFKTAPDGWKNSVRHNLSLNKCFEKIENPNSDGTHSRKGCLWAMNPSKIKKMDEEIAKWNKKDMIAIKRSMANPDLLDTLTKGQGAYLMDRSRSLRHNYQTSHLTHRPGVRIVTAIQPPHTTNNSGHQHVTIGQGQILERPHYPEPIDFNKLAEDAADLFGEHEDFVLDPSLSEFALQNGTLEDFSSDLLDLPPLHHTSPMTSPMKSTQMYNSNAAVMPIY